MLNRNRGVGHEVKSRGCHELGWSERLTHGGLRWELAGKEALPNKLMLFQCPRASQLHLHRVAPLYPQAHVVAS